MRILIAALLFSATAWAQQNAPQNAQQQPAPSQPASSNAARPALTDPNAVPVTSPSVHKVVASVPNAEAYTLPAGTRIAITLKHAISTKSAREGDSVYAETSFPVVSNGHIVIPVGTYVQGTVQRSLRPGHIKGRGELVLHFNSLIFPSGYTLLLPSAVDSAPGAENARMKDKQEGTLENGNGKVTAKDAGAIASAAGGGAVAGAIATDSRSGTLAGAGIGAGIALGAVMLKRGPDVRLETGALVDMVLQRDITVEHELAK